MQQQHPQQERLHTLTNAKETPNKNYPLIEREQIDNTPFTWVKQNDKYFLTIGNYKLTEETETLEETIEKLEKEKWQIIITLQMIARKTEKDIEQKQMQAHVKQWHEQNPQFKEEPYETESL